MIIFRTDANPQLGFGHLSRCRTLAYKLYEQGEECVMVGPDTSYLTEIDKVIFKEWIPQKWLSPAEDVSSLVSISREYKKRKFVMDDYRISEEYQVLLKENRFIWLQFEARKNIKILANIIVNTNPESKESDYSSAVSDNKTKFLLGAKYALLKNEFLKIKKVQVRPIKKVLVTFGAGDDRGGIELILKSLLASTDAEIKFIVVSGATNPRNESNRLFIELEGNERVKLEIAPDNISKIFNSCDVAFMAGGSTTYEIALLGIPMVLFSIAENQVLHSKAWVNKGVAMYLGPIEIATSKDIVEAFEALFESEDLRESMSTKGSELVDGKGAQRMAKELINYEK